MFAAAVLAVLSTPAVAAAAITYDDGASQPVNKCSLHAHAQNDVTIVMHGRHAGTLPFVHTRSI